MPPIGTIADGDAYRLLFDSNPHPMWVFDRSSLRFLAVNDAAARHYGYSREEFLGMTILDIRPAEDVERVRQSLVPNLSAPQIWTHRRKDGSTLRAEIVAHDLMFLDRAARLVLAVDITERERNAKLLERSSRTLQTVLRAAPVGVLVVEPSGEFNDFNDEAKNLLGRTGHTSLSPLIQATLLGAAQEGVEIEIEPGRWVDVKTRPIELDEGSRGAVVVVSDATERRESHGRLAEENEHLESQVRDRTAALELSDAELQEFCFSVSHDLRGPLRAVDGFTQSVLSDEHAVLTDENRDALQRVRRAATRMGSLIDGLLVLSRVARAPMSPRRIDLTKLATSAAADLARSNPTRRIRFDIAPGAVAYGDPKLVTLLLECLMGNAVKFTSRRENAVIEIFADNDGWVVRDNGAGFDMAFATKLFKPFERLHANADYPGNGIGLAVADRIVRRHGGFIEGIGVPDEGSTFRFSLPNIELA